MTKKQLQKRRDYQRAWRAKQKAKEEKAVEVVDAVEGRFFTFHTEEEAKAFVKGVNFVNDSAVSAFWYLEDPKTIHVVDTDARF